MLSKDLVVFTSKDAGGLMRTSVIWASISCQQRRGVTLDSYFTTFIIYSLEEVLRSVYGCHRKFSTLVDGLAAAGDVAGKRAGRPIMVCVRLLNITGSGRSSQKVTTFQLSYK